MRPKITKSETESNTGSDPAAAAGFSRLTRRDIVRAGGVLLGASLAGSGLLSDAVLAATEPVPVPLAVEPGKLALRDGAPESAVVLCQPQSIGPVPLTDTLTIRLRNALANPVAMSLRGNGGPLSLVTPVNAGAEDALKITLRNAGTMLAEFTTGTPPCVAAVIVPESSPSTADRDEVMLIEEWRVRADGSLAIAGTNEGDSSRIFTLNRKLTSDFKVRRHERLRLRFINASQRSVMAVRIENHDLRVIASDSRPAEPYPALNGQIALAPGSRIDVLLDAKADAGSTANLLLHDGTAPRTLARLVYAPDALRPAPLPEAPPLVDTSPPIRPDLRNAQRVELPFDGKPDPKGWSSQAIGLVTPAFTAKRGRTVSLAIANKTNAPVIFRLNGIHARLLDRLDDGWKPYWVDTVAVDSGQTTRIAFVPNEAGLYFVEGFAPVWSAPLLLRSFAVT
jgi:FtsP/CotA-like multicopper oxidase with cupredoxin domain